MEIILLITSIIVIIIIAIIKIVRENKTKRENRIVRFVDNFIKQYDSKKDKWGFNTFIKGDMPSLKNEKEINEAAKRVEHVTRSEESILEIIKDSKYKNSSELKSI